MFWSKHLKNRLVEFLMNYLMYTITPNINYTVTSVTFSMKVNKKRYF